MLLPIRDTKQVSENFKTREFIIVDNSNQQYEQYITLQATQDRCSILDNYKVGEIITASFNLQGRKYEKNGETKYFNSLVAWKLNHVGSSDQPAEQPKEAAASAEESSDLPF